MSDIDITSEKERFRIAILLDCYGSLLTEKQRVNMEMYFQDDLSLSEISEIQHISRQGVRDSLQTGIRALISYDEKLGFAEKCKAVEFIKEELSKIAEDERIPSDLKKRLTDIINGGN